MAEQVKGSETNDDMKYVRNNLYGYGYREQAYIAPTKTQNEIDADIDSISGINDAQTVEIDTLKMNSAADIDYNPSTGTLQLLNQDGVFIGHPVNISVAAAGISIDNIELVHEDDHGNEGLFLKFTISGKNEEGEPFTNYIYCDVDDLYDLYTAGDGITIDGTTHTVSVKIADDNPYIEVTESGITTSGLEEKFDEIDSKIYSINEGEGLVTNNPHEVAFGEYNVSHTSEDASGQTIFSIGNGADDENRSNALEVMKDGTVYLNVEGEMMNINVLLGQIAHEIY